MLTVFLALPWLGVEYARELERVLRDAQDRTLAGTAQAVAIALHDRPRLFDAPVRLVAPTGNPPQDLVDAAAARPVLSAGARWPRRSSSRSCRGSRARPRASASSTAISASSRTRELRSSAPSTSSRRTARSSTRCSRCSSRGRPRISSTTAGRAACPARRELVAALDGIAATGRRNTADARAVVVAAAHPIWVGDRVRGVVLVEETTNAVLAERNRAFERLFSIVVAILVSARWR